MRARFSPASPKRIGNKSVRESNAMDQEEYKKRFGVEPRQDDLERVNCSRAGQALHQQCGVCEECNKPRFMCSPLAEKPKS